MACGNTVARPARATPCSASFHHGKRGMPRRSTGSARSTAGHLLVEREPADEVVDTALDRQVGVAERQGLLRTGRTAGRKQAREGRDDHERELASVHQGTSDRRVTLPARAGAGQPPGNRAAYTARCSHGPPRTHPGRRLPRQSGLKRLTPLATATLVIGANLPDVDIVANAWGADISLLLRRGCTHGVARDAGLAVRARRRDAAGRSAQAPRQTGARNRPARRAPSSRCRSWASGRTRHSTGSTPTACAC